MGGPARALVFLGLLGSCALRVPRQILGSGEAGMPSNSYGYLRPANDEERAYLESLFRGSS